MFLPIEAILVSNIEKSLVTPDEIIEVGPLDIIFAASLALILTSQSALIFREPDPVFCILTLPPCKFKSDLEQLPYEFHPHH